LETGQFWAIVGSAAIGTAYGTAAELILIVAQMLL